MGVVPGLLVWAVLAIIGIASAGFWGFLGVAFLYVAYYGLLRPRVHLHLPVLPHDARLRGTRSGRRGRAGCGA
jgi:hypothetical protein